MKKKEEIHGDFPEFGAIFMANRRTMEECLEKKLFGLPSSNGDFVKRVRAGMVLFLFEYERRRLFGVFQATTDGHMNIVPSAYSSSGKQFPAQVRINTIWECEPLSEAEFGDAIWENYYDRKKFRFGLSQDQVTRLLLLFESKRVEVASSENLSCGTKWLQKYHGGDREMEIEGSIFLRKLSSEISPFSYNKVESSPSYQTGNNDEPHASGCEQESGAPKLEKKPKNSKDSPKDSTDLGDFIPLPSLDDSDCEVEPFEPHLPLMLLSGVPSSSTDDCHLKEDTQNCSQVASHKKLNGNHIPIKGLYSDVEGEKSSVFSRLNYGSNNIGQERGESFEENTRGHDSVQDVISSLLQRRGSWRKTDAYCDKSFPKEKRSVFSRLALSSESSIQENVTTTCLQRDVRNESVRRARFSFQEGKGNYKWNLTAEHLPETLEQNGCWKKARERDISYQDLGHEENFKRRAYLGKMLKRRGQTEESFGDGLKSKQKFEHPPQNKLVRPLLEMPSEVETITSKSYANQIHFDGSSADKEISGSCEVPIKGNMADEKIDTTVNKEMQPFLDPSQCEGGNREAESNSGFNTHDGNDNITAESLQTSCKAGRS